MNVLSIIHAARSYVTVGALCSAVTLLITTRNKQLEHRKLKLEIQRLQAEDREKLKANDRAAHLEMLREKILSVARDQQKQLRPGASPLYQEDDLARACSESVSDVLTVLAVLEQQHIADPEFAVGYWRIRV